MNKNEYFKNLASQKEIKELGNREAFAFFEVGGEDRKISYLFYHKELKGLYH